MNEPTHNQTPRTDVLEQRVIYGGLPNSESAQLKEFRNFARTLERELVAAKQLPHALELQSLDRQISELTERLAAKERDLEALKDKLENYEYPTLIGANEQLNKQLQIAKQVIEGLMCSVDCLLEDSYCEESYAKMKQFRRIPRGGCECCNCLDANNAIKALNLAKENGYGK